MLLSMHIKLGRTMLRMNQTQLAQAVGLSVITIKRIEKNDQAIENASLKIVKKIKKIFEDKGIEFLHPENENDVVGIGIRYHGEDKRTITGG